jgi:hypothetical protein
VHRTVRPSQLLQVFAAEKRFISNVQPHHRQWPTRLEKVLPVPKPAVISF